MGVVVWNKAEQSRAEQYAADWVSCEYPQDTSPMEKVDPAEFDSVFFAPLVAFADEALFRLEVMSDGTFTRKVPHYQLGDDNIWGVTAAVLVMLVNVAYDAGLDLQHNWIPPA